MAPVVTVRIDHLGVASSSVSSLCACPCRPYPQALTFPRPTLKLQMGLVMNGPHGAAMRAGRRVSVTRRLLVAALAREKAEGGEEGGADIEEICDDPGVVMDEEALERQRKASQLKKRVIFGVGIGFSVGGIILAGGWVFTGALASAVFVGAREYFELVRSKGIASGMTPPPRYVSRVCSVICALMPLLTL